MTTTVAAEAELSTDLPTDCAECGQRLLLRRPGRTQCERCRLGRTRPAEDAPAAELEAKQPPPPAIPCAGCQQAVNEDGQRVPLADGFCLGCRIDGRHRS